MKPRVVLLSVLDPCEARGLAAEVGAAHSFGADVVPICSATVRRRGASETLDPVPARRVQAALAAAFERPVDALLVGTLPGLAHARVLARLLEHTLPETLLLAPQSPSPDMGRPGRFTRNLLRRRILPEATVVLLERQAVATLLGCAADATIEQAARAVQGTGALAAWVVDQGPYGRGVDYLATATGGGLLDYPRGHGPGYSAVAGGLAALLAAGMDLREAVERAHRHARGVGDTAYAPVRRARATP